jgi:uncharacterized protein YgiM (DUF1202 family)
MSWVSFQLTDFQLALAGSAVIFFCYVILALLQLRRPSRALNGWDIGLVLLATLIPLVALTTATLRDMLTEYDTRWLILTSIGAIGLGLLLLLIERRNQQLLWLQSRGVLAVSIGIILASASYVVPTVLHVVSSLSLVTPVQALDSQQTSDPNNQAAQLAKSYAVRVMVDETGLTVERLSKALQASEVLADAVNTHQGNLKRVITQANVAALTWFSVNPTQIPGDIELPPELLSETAPLEAWEAFIGERIAAEIRGEQPAKMLSVVFGDLYKLTFITTPTASPTSPVAASATSTATPTATITPTITWTPIAASTIVATATYAFGIPTVSLSATPLTIKGTLDASQEAGNSAGCQVLTTANLNLRRSANSSADILSVIPISSALTAIATTTDRRWWQVSYRGQNGWVVSDYLTLDAACDQIR